MSKVNTKKETLEKKEAMREINDNEVKNVSGGGTVFKAGSTWKDSTWIAQANKRDGTNAVGVFDDEQSAKDFVKRYGDKVNRISDVQVPGGAGYVMYNG